MTNCGVYAPETPNKSKNPRIFSGRLISSLQQNDAIIFKQKSIEAFILDHKLVIRWCSRYNIT